MVSTTEVGNVSGLSEVSKEDLKKEIESLRKQLKHKKYGLVWDKEREPEQVVLDCEKNLPILNEIKNKEIKTNNDNYNLLIEGDNYHTLTCLNYTHKEKIDVIYIDPPYNTGNSDFRYNDKFVNKEDNYRHSKWLNFMEKRLRLSKNLLSKSGVIIISIDDNEQANLKLLCDKIFRENKTKQMIWRKSGDSRDGKMKNTTTFRIDHEYLLVCFNNIEKLNKLIEKPNFKNSYGNPDNDSRGNYKTGSISRKEEASNQNHKNYYSVISPKGKVYTRQFDISKKKFETLEKEKKIYWG